MKITLGLLRHIDFGFWLKSNDYYSEEKFSTNVNVGYKHAEKAGLINEFRKKIKTNRDLINLIKERINLVNSPDQYSDNDLLIIFDLIQAWGGPTGRNPYIFNDAPRINSNIFSLISANGSKPTELVILVLPPTQSCKLNIFNHFSVVAFLNNLLSLIVIAIALEFHSRSLFSKWLLMISIAILGSGVPPDLLTTTNNVVDNFSDNSSNVSLIKKGSILSI